MRILIKRRSSTKPERIFYEILKKNHIPFKHRVKIEGREIDFIVSSYAIEIDGHSQSHLRNAWIISQGYTPIHYTNKVLLNNPKGIEEDIVSKYVLLTTTNQHKSSR